jgi:hypothetical protein
LTVGGHIRWAAGGHGHIGLFARHQQTRIAPKHRRHPQAKLVATEAIAAAQVQ